GYEHVRFIEKTLKKLKRIYVYDVNESMADKLITDLSSEISVPIIKGESFEAVAKSCQVLSSATIITLDNFGCVKREWVGAGQTILPCDLNTFWEASVQRDADKYIVDSIDEHELFAGMGYFPEGLPEIYGETGEIVAGLKAGRENDNELIVCSNIGMSVFDVAMGKVIFDKALEEGKGQLLTL
ncbi:MAG: hypothetical protein ACRCUS_00210, partial [Anaerovoracaceae bacterium]